MARSYSALLKKAGLPAPDGLANIPARPKAVRDFSPDNIAHIAEIFGRVCRARTSPGANLEAAIVSMLNELKRLKS